MKADKASISWLIEAIRKLGLLPTTGDSGGYRGEGEGELAVALLSVVGAPYLIVACCDTPEAWVRERLLVSNTIGAALLLDSEGNILKAFRKSFRTGDIDLAPGFERPKSVQRSIAYSDAPQVENIRPLEPLNAKLENVLFEVHSAIRDIDGLHAPDALDEICKLLYAKLFDEEHAVKLGNYRFRREIYATTEECAASVRQLYLDAVNYDDGIFSNRIPSYERSRGVFRNQIGLSSSAIAKIVSIIEHFDITNSPVDIKGRAFQNVLIPATRAGMGQYFTPKAVIDLTVALLSPSVRDVIIDPFCGSGHFLTSALDLVRSTGSFSEKQFHEFAFSRLHGVEKSDRMVRVAMTDMRLHGDGHSNIRCTDALVSYEAYADLFPETFDIVATNPPFGVDLPPEALEGLGPFEILKSRRAQMSSVSLEILAIDRCLSLLRPGGRMAIVLPDGILSNRQTSYVREFIKDKSVIRAIVSLPVETFTPFGANIKTSVLVLRKRFLGENVGDGYRIFLADLHSVGHDAAGRAIEHDDYSKLIDGFSKFILSEGW